MSHSLQPSYCAPYGGVNTYKPFLLPAGIGLLRPPRVFPPLANASRLVPVVRTEDYNPMHFFYYGEGCSDTFIRVSARDGMVAYDRLDALRKLAPHRASKILLEKCSHQIETSAVQHLPWSLIGESSSADMSLMKAAVTGSGCLNEVTHLLMRTHSITTLVLNFEAPGSGIDSTERSRKTEIIYLGTEFYDARGAPCTLEQHEFCYYCNNSVYSRAACHGQLRRAMAPRRRPAPPSPPPLLAS